MTRTATRFVLLVALLGLTYPAGQSLAQQPPPANWEWDEYDILEMGKKVTYLSPGWLEHNTNNIAELGSASGKLKYPLAPPITQVVMKVYKWDATKKSYDPNSVITDTKASFIWKGPPASVWLLSGGDTANPRAQLPLGSKVKFVWEITTNAGNSKVEVETVAKNQKK